VNGVIDLENPLEFDLEPPSATAVFYYVPLLRRLDESTRSTFALPTGALASIVERHTDPRERGFRELASPTSSVSNADPAVSEVPVLRAVEELKAWLNISYEDLGRMAGWQSGSVLHHWRRKHRFGEPVEPRASSVEPILRLHSLIRAVSEAISGDHDGAAVQLWARAPLNRPDRATPLELLLQGDSRPVEAAARELLLDGDAVAPPVWRTTRPTRDEELPIERTSTGEDYGEADFG
jgi:hypothetical protein